MGNLNHSLNSKEKEILTIFKKYDVRSKLFILMICIISFFCILTVNNCQATELSPESSLANSSDNDNITLNKTQIINSGAKVSKYIKKNKKLPEYVMAGKNNLTMAQYLYAISSIISGKNNTTLFKTKEKFYTVSRISKYFNSKEYKAMATKTSNYISYNKKTSAYTNSAQGKIDYYNTIYLFSKIAEYYKAHGKMPSKVYLKTPLPSTARKFSSLYVDKRLKYLSTELKEIKKSMRLVSKKIKNTKNKSILAKLQRKYNRLQEKYEYVASNRAKVQKLKNSRWYVPSSLRKYVKSTAYSDIKNPSIVYMARKLATVDAYTTGESIYNWVRDEVAYAFYYRTKYGATKTLKYRKGNCVDEAHLIVAMARSAGLPARYVRGNCKFIKSGNYYTHVWAQIWIRGYGWITADPTSYSNTFGGIKNWNKSKSTIYGTLKEYSL
ncbi:transglutaminase-like domain-containing protein [Methanobacterium alcaliphilum]|uniref:transglutaminase-like domain-containing protein n=1 Tax=Methanobacterium alcaliphilum TaxID=392018 RepID=UPI00200A38B5|nr:transglutaminase family protein [Methanobacterium alcaliphilum]MCK9150853.1 transglutaminase family protein [Methanobacterium alcaliphilum]